MFCWTCKAEETKECVSVIVALGPFRDTAARTLTWVKCNRDYISVKVQLLAPRGAFYICSYNTFLWDLVLLGNIHTMTDMHNYDRIMY